jgi:hypothetical protein
MSVVGTKEPESINSAISPRGDMFDVTPLGPKLLDLGLVHVEAGDVKASPAKLPHQRQSHVTQPDDAHAGPLALDLRLQFLDAHLVLLAIGTWWPDAGPSWASYAIAPLR